ncbi:hypothetical protein DNTS_012090 [Danionella cerebrum]|uniref:Solute carrier family 66 member 3 n=1 Tax=Danionella cerebrum TaxID=2873325 RepID=A0A553PV95_9TELE|nr:hypothetical protein DNTS_012090 [Danionella translucida]
MCVNVVLRPEHLCRAWGESLFGLIQFAVLALLVQHYRDKSIKGILQLLLYGGAMYFLTSPVAPATVVWTLHEWNVVLIIAARDTGLFSFSSQLHALATCCSGVLLAQILLCWNKRTANSDKEARGVKKDKAD